MIKQSKISVRHLVEFILRRGSIDNRKKSSHTALEGAESTASSKKMREKTMKKKSF